MTAPGRAPRAGMSIGAVLERLRPQFPDVTISKIRFLESEGLVTPQRSPSGYRQFSVADCERLAYVLAAQRDHYLPLKVIREHLDALDEGREPAGPGPRAPRALAVADPLVPPDAFATDRALRLTREELLERADVGAELLAELEAHGLLRPGPAGLYPADATVVARTAGALARHGLDPRHLRSLRTAAQREADLVAQVAAPVARQRDAGAAGRAEELAREVAALTVTLHAALVGSALREAGTAQA
ncbi:MerR family transcriptional regulator [Rhodococcus aerolatus]